MTPKYSSFVLVLDRIGTGGPGCGWGPQFSNCFWYRRDTRLWDGRSMDTFIGYSLEMQEGRLEKEEEQKVTADKTAVLIG